MRACGFNAAESEYGQVSRPCGHVSEPSLSIKFSKCLELLTLFSVSSQINTYLIFFSITYFGQVQQLD